MSHSARDSNRRATFLLLAAAFFVSPTTCAGQSVNRLSGRAMATTYEIVYGGPRTGSAARTDSLLLQAEIDSLLHSLNSVFSTFDKNSEVSRINNSRDTTIVHVVGNEFADVFQRASDIYFDSGKTFNPAIGPLSLAWGIASDENHIPDEAQLQRLRKASSLRHFRLSTDDPSIPSRWQVNKYDSLAALDFNGIAKGYAVDKMAMLVAARGHSDFLVEFGGEIRTSGNHPQGRPWQIAIEFPGVSVSKAQTVLSISDISVATSGNYRSVRYREGRKIVHTLQPQTGLPESNDLLSVTVLAADCTKADAFATAFMVMGSERAIKFLSERQDLDAYLMIGQSEQDFEVFYTPGMQKRLVGE
jgi:FAD:protein FMN transferase